MYCIYKHTAPNNKVYIGITSQNPLRRWNSGSGYRGNEYFTRAINKYGWDNFKHEILFDDLTEKQAKEKEIELIREYKSNIRKYGFNISSGGESHKGVKMSQRQKDLIRKGNLGKTVSQETRAKLSVSSRRNWSNPQYVQHMREINMGELNPMYGKHMSDERKLKVSKPVLQYDMNGNFIKEYISMHEAYNQTNIARNSIKCCCEGKYKHAGGYVWKYKSQGEKANDNICST